MNAKNNIMSKVVFQLDGTIQVFTLGKSSNGKIVGDNRKIVQSYTYSVDQYNYVKTCVENNEKVKFKTFFSLDAKNCFDCPFSINGGNGGCYTHKIVQYFGFVSSLKHVVRLYPTLASVPTFSNESVLELVKMAQNRYVRFGSYGEPSMHPIELVEQMTNVAKNWTGYTHQYFRKNEFAKFFMASVHNEKQAQTARNKFGFRSFIATETLDIEGVSCPASKESGYKSTCANCGLCSGMNGKGNKDVKILVH